jgi:hypothetical protein
MVTPAPICFAQKVERQRRLPISAQGFQPWDNESTPDELCKSWPTPTELSMSGNQHSQG